MSTDPKHRPSPEVEGHAARREQDKRDDTGEPAPTTSELRGRMASRRTIGKSSAEEPAAAPFDTDDEAAGRPAGSEAVRRAESEQYVKDRAERGRRSLEARMQRRVGALAGIAAAVIVIVVIALLFAAA